MIRITADIDRKKYNTLGYYLNKSLHKIKGIKEIIIKPSNKKGYHIIIWTNYKYNKKQILLIRRYIGDDKTRINIDRYRKIGYQTLFDKKKRLRK